MNKWKETELSRIGDVVSGGTPSTSVSNFWNGDILFVTPFDLSKISSAYIENTERKISKKGLENSSANLLPIDSIIISSRAPIGYVAIAKKEFTTNQGCKSIVLYKDFDAKYIYYSLLQNVDLLKKVGGGTTFAEISKGDLEKVKLPHPSAKTEQQRIAKILSTADAVIEKTHAAIAKYKAIKQGMLQDLFTRGIDTTTNQLRPRYEDATHLYKESELGIIPKEWDAKNIEAIGDIVTGSTPPTARSEYYGNEVLFVSPADIQDNFFIHDTGKKLTQSGFDVTRKLPENSICVVCIGSTIGKMALLSKEGCTNQQINSIVCFDPELAFYFFYAMRLYNEPQFRRETGLQAVPIVNKSQFSEFLLPVTEKTESLIISERLKAIDNKLQIEQTYLHKIQLLKKGLMEDLLSGKNQVKFEEELIT